MASLVTIGDFSRASHLTVKTLRHYHDAGLLEPSDVDPETGYRYYSTEQIPVAQVIRRLRNLRMPVGEVKRVLAAPDADARNRLIAEHLTRLESELAETRAAVGELRDLLQPSAPHPIEHRTTPATPAIAVQATVAREDLYAWWQGAIGELTATAHAHGLRRTGPVGGLYGEALFHEGRGPATVYLPCDGEVRAVGRVVTLTLPPAELAVARHDGSLRDVDRTYGALAAHVIKHEIGVAGPLREHYLRGVADTADPAEWQTEIGWPVFRTHA
jgi:DNA-binding transcriptional MerR regulator